MISQRKIFYKLRELVEDEEAIDIIDSLLRPYTYEEVIRKDGYYLYTIPELRSGICQVHFGKLYCYTTEAITKMELPITGMLFYLL